MKMEDNPIEKIIQEMNEAEAKKIYARDKHLLPWFSPKLKVVLQPATASAIRSEQVKTYDASQVNLQKIATVMVIVKGGGISMISTPEGYQYSHGLVDRLREFAYICD